MYSTSPSYYDYYSYPSPSVSSSAVGAGLASAIGAFTLVFIMLIILAFVVLGIIAQWKIFKKAGEEGWKALIPIYNVYTLLNILSMEPLLCLLSFVPGAWFILSIVMDVKLAQSFKKGTGFALGLIFLGPIFSLILAFGSAKYTKLPSSK